MRSHESSSTGPDAAQHVYEKEKQTPQSLSPHSRLGTQKIIAFTANDAENPKNWSLPFKWYCTSTVAFTCFEVALNSSIVTSDIPGVSKQFGVSNLVSVLTITLFVLGLGTGELLLKPLGQNA